MIRLLLPNDAPREFLLPMKAVYAQEKFKEIMTSNGLFFKPDSIKYVTEYIVKWGQYLVSSGKAEIMRMQMGWVDDGKVLYMIDEAMKRIKDGTYGSCLQCGKPISSRRLAALPHSELCIDCQKSNDEVK